MALVKEDERQPPWQQPVTRHEPRGRERKKGKKRKRESTGVVKSNDINVFDREIRGSILGPHAYPACLIHISLFRINDQLLPSFYVMLSCACGFPF